MEGGGIQIGWAEILIVTSAILAPLVTVIKVLYDGKEGERVRADKKDDEWLSKYETMRDRMQEKIDSANMKANDAVSTVTTALNGMTQAMAAMSKERQEESKRLVEEVAAKIRELIVK